jgi:hypothetical protein
MRRAVLGATFLLAGTLLLAGRPLHSEDSDDISTLKVGGLSFYIPDRWVREPAENPARAAQWLIPPHRGETEGAEVVVIYFGPGVGGGAQENIEAWSRLLTGADGLPPKPQPETRTVMGHKITVVLLSGTYAQAHPQPGIPPTLKPAYSLLGAVVENPGGNIYWRLTGPAAEVAELEPVFSKVLNSLRPQVDKP